MIKKDIKIDEKIDKGQTIRVFIDMDSIELSKKLNTEEEQYETIIPAEYFDMTIKKHEKSNIPEYIFDFDEKNIKYSVNENKIVEAVRRLEKSKNKEFNTLKGLAGYGEISIKIDEKGNEEINIEEIELYEKGDIDSIYSTIDKFIDKIHFDESDCKHEKEVKKTQPMTSNNKKYYSVYGLIAGDFDTNFCNDSLKNTIKEIYNLPIRPDRVLVDNDDISLDFTPKGNIIFDSEDRLQEFIFKFQEYIEGAKNLDLTYCDIGYDILDEIEDKYIINDTSIDKERFETNKMVVYGYYYGQKIHFIL
ncbi:TPA: hypothetical protein KQC85_003141 [Clostridioides difficile]|nr:hypothetical protein [Clostridioides difficile]